MKDFPEGEGIKIQPEKTLISSLTLHYGTAVAPLLLLYLQLGRNVTNVHHLGEFTPRICSNSFVQSAVDARRRSDKIPNSGVAAETKKLLANSFYGYQNIDSSRNTATKYFSGEETHAANNSKLLGKIDHLNNSWYAVELAKAQIERKEPILVGFFFLQYAKLRMLERSS